jgi:hypothetical protein
MAWIRLEQNCISHPKVAPLSNGAFRLWVHAIAYSNQHGLDGILNKAAIVPIAGPTKAKKNVLRHAKELVGARLWHDRGSHWEIHDYLDYQPSAEQIAEMSEKKRSAGQKGGRAKASRSGGSATAPREAQPTNQPVEPTGRTNPLTHAGESGSEIEFRNLELLGFERFGQLGGSSASKMKSLCPIAQWEWDAVLNTEGASWGYVAKVLKTMREEQAKPRPPPTGEKPESERTYLDVSRELAEQWRKEDAEKAAENEQG